MAGHPLAAKSALHRSPRGLDGPPHEPQV